MAIATENGTAWLDKIIRVSVARPGKKDVKYCKILISNVSTTLTQEDLISIFRKVSKMKLKNKSIEIHLIIID